MNVPKRTACLLNPFCGGLFRTGTILNTAPSALMNMIGMSVIDIVSNVCTTWSLDSSSLLRLKLLGRRSTDKKGSGQFQTSQAWVSRCNPHQQLCYVSETKLARSCTGSRIKIRISDVNVGGNTRLPKLQTTPRTGMMMIIIFTSTIRRHLSRGLTVPTRMFLLSCCGRIQCHVLYYRVMLFVLCS
jgi:hypothetical protein